MKQLGNLAYMTLVCGPLCGSFIALLGLPRLIGLPNFGFLEGIWFVSVLYVMGMLAGLVSYLIWPGPRTVKEGKRGGVWDTELAGPV